MRRFTYALMVCTALSPISAFADDITVDSAISAATVYTNRATLTRSAKVEIPEGAHTLVFNGLPLNVDVNSLRADGRSTGKVTFGAVSHKRASSEDFVHPKEQELNTQLQTLQDQKRVFDAEKQALQVGRSFLENLGKTASLRENEEIAKIELNSENWGAASDNLTAKVAQNLKQGIELDIKIRDTNEKIQKVQNDLNQLRTGQKQSYTVTIPFESASATTLNVDLDYQISNVGWRPVYDARLDTKSGALELVQYGSVWQRTGEDWDGIKLILSTAQPSRGAALPDLYPHWISIYDNTVRTLQKASRAEAFGGAVMSMDMAAAPTASNVMMEDDATLERVSIQSAQINTEGFVGEYNITGPADVKSDGTQSKLLIGAFETDNKLQVQVKPQFDTNAYLVAKATLKGEAPILPGQVSLFRDGAFIGQGNLPMLRQGDEQDLGFGIDDNVTVTRNTVKDERSETGMITKDNVLERHFVTEIKNLHKTSVEVAILENTPVSQDERIRVEFIKTSTTQGYETDIDDKKGVTRWITTLEPKASAKINIGWKVSWPKGENISGL
ncbi:MAG: mucoidy inhibitor MuiA family protein [Alphaproteobacteria bacterium]